MKLIVYSECGRSQFGLLLAACLVLVACSSEGDESAGKKKLEQTSMVVFKQASCGCCGSWADHVEQFGISTEVRNEQNMTAIKTKLGIQPNYRSCHTATVGNYVFEGHIPAHAISRFLNAPPEGALGLAVPGMPVGSPGMEMGNRFDEYDVLLLKDDGSSEVFLHVSDQSQNNRPEV